MKINLEPFRAWFGFTRRERRASFILLLILVIVLALRMAMPDKSADIEDITASLFIYSDKNKSDAVKENVKDKFIPAKRSQSDTPLKKRSYAGYVKKAPLDLNSCDTSQLIKLPGIGPVLSARIIKYRNLLGGYASVSQLNEVYGLPSETYELIKDRLFADTTLLVRININSAGYKDLTKLPYFEKYEVQAILKYRQLKGRIGALNEMVDNKLIPGEKAIKVAPYLNFR
jgi:DNA uptake protein ComE-like DNA-binding protein